jgi:hypothetical protein
MPGLSVHRKLFNTMVSALARPMYALGSKLIFWGAHEIVEQGGTARDPVSVEPQAAAERGLGGSVFSLPGPMRWSRSRDQQSHRVEHRLVLGKEDERCIIVITDRKPPRRVSMCRG